MSKPKARSAIRLRGVRHNNLKNFDLDLPLNRMIVVTGLSGSGKSSLAFDTLFAEGQRRYIETFSPYARQFFDRMDKPKVDSIEGIPPAVAIEQRNSVKSTRSTVGTMTEICDYMKVLWPHVAQLHCRQCAQPVRKDTPRQVLDSLNSRSADGNGGANLEQLITFDLPLSEKLPLEDSLALISKQGYQRLLLDSEMIRLDEALSRLRQQKPGTAVLTVIQDRLKPSPANRARFVEACEQAYHFGKGKLTLWDIYPGSSVRDPRPFSRQLHCARCNLEYREPSPALFSFNHPVGACPACRGFGRIISIDYDLALPDRSKTLAEGAVKPWLTGQGADCQTDLMRMCRKFHVPTDVPFEKLSNKWQNFVIEGEPGYGKDAEHEWPRAWYGIKGYFRWLESKAYKMHVRVLLSRYRSYTTCQQCQGNRFQPEALLYRLPMAANRSSTADLGRAAEPVVINPGGELLVTPGESLTLADFYQLPIRIALQRLEPLRKKHHSKNNDPLHLALTEVCSRLGYLVEVGLPYLTLDRTTRSLSGGETERVNLTTCLGTRLVNTLYVLDEPSVGLHPRDTERLVRILHQLRDTGNTVLVVEHEPSVMRAADQIVDLGPGHGATGGQIMFQGSYAEILKSGSSLTGQYLSGNRQIPIPDRRPVGPAEFPSTSGAYVLNDARAPITRGNQDSPSLKLSNVRRNNLKDITVEIPLGRFVCITGVSGSGKTTLIREVLLPALETRLKARARIEKASDRIGSDEDGEESENRTTAGQTGRSATFEGGEHLTQVVLVDQAILGKTPRSNPGVYIGAFDDIRELFAQSDAAAQRGLNASAFSFNSGQGQCERCRGAGFEKIEMQFLSDVFIRCPDCQGRRYRPHILEVKIKPPSETPTNGSRQAANGKTALSIADVLDSTIDEVLEFLAGFPGSRPAQRALESLRLLQEVGLGYLKLGQPINTLSGGESQRLKLVRHLAGVTAPVEESRIKPAVLPSKGRTNRRVAPESPPADRTLFLFDEPTTGLHFEDVRVLLKVFQRLVDAGHSVVVIEHNLDVIKSADWLIDLGPDAGDEGGEIVAEGPPEQVAACPNSHTGRALREILPSRTHSRRLAPA